MNVLEEIVQWSKDRPIWQRDALRRLVQNGDLSEEDIGELREVCKSAHGLAEQRDSIPLESIHVPEKNAGAMPVTLASIFHHRGVNALAEGQTLKFGSSLTVVYGDNAAGKTGYIRILKSACHARGPEKILGNVVSGIAPQKVVVAITYKVGTEDKGREWSGNGGDEFISRVSVFDTQCAAVYLTEKTDVAFRPFGLDLFDKLVKACKSVRSGLESEQRALSVTQLAALQLQVAEGTAVAKLLLSLTSLTKAESVRALAHLSADDEARLGLLEKSLLDLQANDPKKLLQQLTVRATRVRTLAQHLRNVETTLSEEGVGAVFQVRKEGRRKSEEAKRLRAITFTAGVLNGTGSELWLALWEAAREFSHSEAYANKQFPVVEEGGKCVLCQQLLDEPAGDRLKKFEVFVTSTTEKELREARATFSRLQKAIKELQTSTDSFDETVNEIRIEHEIVADKIATALVENEKRRKAVALALSSDSDLSPVCPNVQVASQEAEALAKQLDERMRTLREKATDEKRKRMSAEVQELRARKVLAANEQAVLDEIERKKKVAAYELCLNDTRTQAITQKSTAVTRSSVTQKLKDSFQKELLNLGFSHVEVELKEVGGAEGVLYHKLMLTRAPGVELPRVVSEGEQRCLSIASFLAELSTADDPSGIVFDDPVSSLDYKWREGVARRLVQEAKTRQVIVFTHDIVFLLLLKQFSEEQKVEQLDQHVRQLALGAGVCVEEMPWVAMPAKKKIGYLKSQWQAADKLHREGHQSAYEKEAKYLYGLLRETWERALEEVLLGGIVERFRPSVQTQHIRTIADITEEDCSALESAMTKCSRWLPGHDQAPAAQAEIPDPKVLKADIDALESWVVGIRKRRTS
jgi:energy-coupling factor transporter ATP-binding protein EcfA2